MKLSATCFIFSTLMVQLYAQDVPVPSNNTTSPPTPSPTSSPSSAPTSRATGQPSNSSDNNLSRAPTEVPSSAPVLGRINSDAPSHSPSSRIFTGTVSLTPTGSPSVITSANPSATPIAVETTTPSKIPTNTPSGSPNFEENTTSSVPTSFPTDSPMVLSTPGPTVTSKTNKPTNIPSNTPTISPSKSRRPSSASSMTDKKPTSSPSVKESLVPSKAPSRLPSETPTISFGPSFISPFGPASSMAPSFNGERWVRDPLANDTFYHSHGIMFDLQSIAGLIIKSVHVVIESNTEESFDIEVYSKSGTWDGYQRRPTAWTVILEKSIMTASNGLYTPLNLDDKGVVIIPYERTALFINIKSSLTGGKHLASVLGTEYGKLVQANDVLALYEGTPKNHDFTFTPDEKLIFNGVIKYEIPDPSSKGTWETLSNSENNSSSSSDKLTCFYVVLSSLFMLLL